MKHLLERTVYYSDTDAYGVAWHGSYLNWMEQGRVEFCRELGLDLTELMKKDITIPVTNINIRYKASARLDEKVYVETYVSEISRLTITFTQLIKNKETGLLYTKGEVQVVAVNNEGKIYKHLPDILKNACEAAIEE